MEDKKFRLWRGDHFLRKFIVILLICLILISGYPFFTGQVILSKEVFYGSDIHHNIPQSYYEASSWINEQPEDFRILSLPTQAGWEVYDWGQGERYIGVGVLDDMIQKPIEHYLTGNPVVDYVYQRFQEGSIDGVEKLLCLLNVKYILLHNDADQSIFGGENASYDRDQLISQKNIQLEKAFGALEFYKIPDASFVPHIYATNQYQLVTNASSMYQSIYKGDVDQAQTALTPEAYSDGLMNIESEISDIKITFVPKHEHITGFEIPLSFFFNPHDDVVVDLYENDTNTLLGTDVITRSEITSPVASNPSWCFVSILMQLNISKEYYLRIHRSGAYSYPDAFLLTFNTHPNLLPNATFYRQEHGVWMLKGSPAIVIHYSRYSKPEDVAFFFTEQLNEDEITKIKAVEYEQLYKPDITLQKVDPTMYIVHVNASQPFFLVFSESYDNNWIASIDGQQIPNEYHFTANGFANGWYINKTGTFTITLEFWPQNLFYIGSAISITTLILCVLYVSKDKIKILHQRYLKKHLR